jgi:RimJ/RimL family protein N-acetyltransferase
VIPELRTERLRLRGWTERDVDALDAITTDERVAPWIGLSPGSDPPGTWRAVAAMLGHWVLRGYGLWAVEDATEGTLFGRAGLYQPRGWPGLEVGWTIAADAWGNGYATEAGAAALEWGFTALAVDEIVSMTLPDNVRSRRVMEKLGLSYLRDHEHAGRRHVLYAITRATWEAQR